MILVLPVSDVDLALAEKLVHFIPVNATLLLIVTQKAWWPAEKLLNFAKGYFDDCWAYRLPTENEEGWPESPSHLFYSTVEYLHDIGNTEPFYFFEADNVPLRAGWWQEIKAEYESAGKPYMGVINKTLYQNKLTGKTWYKGRHMVGTGIYPADFFTRCKSVHYMDRRPFDICIEKEVVPDCHDTKLIAHRWSCRNFRWEDGALMMDDKPNPLHVYAKPIPPEAVVVHGCKDGSIYKALDPAPLST